MDTLTKDDILILHKEGSASSKKLLEEKYPKYFPSETYMDQWRGFQKQYKKEDLQLPYPSPQNDDEHYLDAQFMMMHIYRAKRSKKPDFTNDKTKYESAWNLRQAANSGFALADSLYGRWAADTAAGSRLCIEGDLQLVKSIQKEYVLIWEKIMVEP